MLAVALVERLVSGVHSDLRVDAPDAGSNTSSADGPSASPFSEVAAESRAESDDSREGFAVQVWIDAESVAIGLPFAPYFFPSVGSRLHSSIDDPCISSSEITLELTSSVRRKPVQQFCCGSGKEELKKVRNALSFTWYHSRL